MNEPMNSPEDFGRPLAGLKVLELSQIMAGPVCGLLLSDMGADVIKVERFPGGDDARGYQRPGDLGLSPAFVMINRGKRSVALDIRTPEGREALLRLVAQVDVVTENFRVGTMERLGLGQEVLMQANPRLIYASLSKVDGPVLDEMRRIRDHAVVHNQAAGLRVVIRKSSVPGRFRSTRADAMAGCR